MTDYPEHVKSRAAREDMQTVADFLDWCKANDETPGSHAGLIDLLGRWRGIDMDAFTAEQVACEESVRHGFPRRYVTTTHIRIDGSIVADEAVFHARNKPEAAALAAQEMRTGRADCIEQGARIGRIEVKRDW